MLRPFLKDIGVTENEILNPQAAQAGGGIAAAFNAVRNFMF
jgi:hypothetical protein